MILRFLVALLMFAAPVLAQSPGNLPMSMTYAPAGGGLSPATADTTYLRLDATNDPLTSQLTIAQAAASLSTPSLTSDAGSALVLGPAGGVTGRGITLSNSTASSADNGVTITGTSAAATGRTSVLITSGVSSADDRYVLRLVSALGDVARVSGSGLSWAAKGFAAPPSAGGSTPGHTFLGDLDTGMSATAGRISIGVDGGESTANSYFLINNNNHTMSWNNGNAGRDMIMGNSGNLTLFGSGAGFGSNGSSVFGRVTGTGATGTRLYGDHNAAALGQIAMIGATANIGAIDNVPLLEFRHNCGASGTTCDSGGGTLIGDVRSLSAGGVKYRGTVFTGAVLDFSDTTFNPHRGTAPASLPTCSTTTVGIRYKEDTDTAGTAPALCLCSRDNAALTYSWKVLNGAGTC